MRQPKFRGFSLETKQWHYGHGWFEIDYTDEYLTENGIEPQALLYTGSYPVECELRSMGEFTGLKDKNGREIYEGDVMPVNGQNCYVVYHEEYARFCLHMKSGRMFIPSKNSEVIGNIYENPELLEETS